MQRVLLPETRGNGEEEGNLDAVSPLTRTSINGCQYPSPTPYINGVGTVRSSRIRRTATTTSIRQTIPKAQQHFSALGRTSEHPTLPFLALYTSKNFNQMPKQVVTALRWSRQSKVDIEASHDVRLMLDGFPVPTLRLHDPRYVKTMSWRPEFGAHSNLHLFNNSDPSSRKYFAKRSKNRSFGEEIGEISIQTPMFTVLTSPRANFGAPQSTIKRAHAKGLSVHGSSKP